MTASLLPSIIFIRRWQWPSRNWAMALAKKLLAFLLMTALLGVSMAAVYKVGDSAGWTMTGNVDYDQCRP
ncbi:hypothetical protein Ddye_015794 [Dipteronia dyeriana]|uniref:Uncharacterized protein n=1 Tax=Dipteronia dyeriana TaxID=168575 RepID=A0AAD9U5H2_9ROSI|nr:hypothetical protein Ddye_015794 [Dipteronia dyeriana]